VVELIYLPIDTLGGYLASTTTSCDGSSTTSPSRSRSHSYCPDADNATDGRHHDEYARVDAAGTPRDAPRTRGYMPGNAPGARGDTAGEKGATTTTIITATLASTTASTTTTSSTPGQAPRIYESQATDLLQFTGSTIC
jgi:hypothetical protein